MSDKINGIGVAEEVKEVKVGNAQTVSKLKKVRIAHFRSLENIEIQFDKGIVCLVGGNESGKTSIMKALGVIMSHAEPMRQAEFIQDGSTGFAIELTLEDGTVVSRVKKKTVNRYEIVYPNGEKWSVSKLDTGLPVEVKKVFNLLVEEETGENLQLRSNTDNLLFVQTPHSTNYKVLYDALKVEQLVKAVSKGNTEVNELKALIKESDNSIEALMDTLQQIVVYDLEALYTVKEKVQEKLQRVEKLDKVQAIVNQMGLYRHQINKAHIVDTLKEIDIKPYQALQTSKDAYDVLKILREKLQLFVNVGVEKLKEIDVSRLNKLEHLNDTHSKLKAKRKELELLNSVSDLPSVDITRYKAVMSLEEKFQRYREQHEKKQAIYKLVDSLGEIELSTALALREAERLCTAYQEKEQKKEEIQEQITKYEKLLQEIGAETVTCTNCGELIVVKKS